MQDDVTQLKQRLQHLAPIAKVVDLERKF